MKRVLWIAVTLALAWQAGLGPAGAVDQNPCQVPGNLTQNCNFDTFSDHSQGGAIKQIPDGWWFFVLLGDPEFRPDVDTYWGAPSQLIWTDGQPFTAGLYQQVAVTPGTFYRAGIGWAAPMKPDFERRLGLDPAGGSDPTAPGIVWGPSSWEVAPWPDLSVGTWATGPTMTLFVWVHHPVAHGDDRVFLDAVGLAPDPAMPTATPIPLPPSPTPTHPRPTRTPTPVPPTSTPTSLPITATPTSTLPAPLLPESTGVTLTATPTLTSTGTVEAIPPTPVPPTASATPTATAVSLAALPLAPPAAASAANPAADPPAAQAAPSHTRTALGVILILGVLGGLGGAVILGVAILWLAWRRR